MKALVPEQGGPGSLAGGIVGTILGVAAFGVVGWAAGGLLGAMAAGIVGAVVGAAMGDRVTTSERRLTADEIAYAREVFGDSIDYEPILITRDSMMSTGSPKAIGNTIHLVSRWGDDIFEPGRGMALTDRGRELLIHEMGHVWQYQNGGFAYVGESLRAQLGALLGKGDRNGAYEWRAAHDAGLPWQTWNPEQQAEAIERYNVCLRATRATPPCATDDDRADLATLQPYLDKVCHGEGAPGFSVLGAVGGGLMGTGMGALVGGAAGGPVGALMGAGMGGLGGLFMAA